jgi:hypothetical protein
VISEILEPLDRLATELLQEDDAHRSHFVRYSDEDIVSAVLVFQHVLGNRAAWYYIDMHDPNRSDIDTNQIATDLGTGISDLVMKMANFDIKKHYAESATYES